MSQNLLLPFSRITRWKLFTCFHFVADIIALAAAWYLTVVLRVYLNPLTSNHVSTSAFKGLIPHPVLIIVLWTGVSLWLGTYRRKILSALQAFVQIIESGVVACALAIVITVLAHGNSDNIARSFVLLFGPISLPLLGLSFYSSAFLAMTAESRWTQPVRVAVVGDGADAHWVIENIQKRAVSPLRVAGIITSDAALSVSGNGTFPVLGTLGQLAEVINRERLDQLICVSNAPADFATCSSISHRMGVTVSCPVAPQWENVRFRYNNDYGFDLVDAEPIGFTPRQVFIKRAADLALASLLLILLSPLLLVLAVLIRLTSRGPIFYKSLRVGRGGRHFTFWKFRSMYTCGARPRELLEHNEAGGHLFKLKHDPRITPLGRFMRRYSLDELPQLINVLRGEMSLVGPRPLPAEDLDPDGLSRAHRSWAEQRTAVLPGITGVWQIRGRSDLTFEQMVEYDMHYIQNWSLALDFQILLETPLAAFSGRGAY